jgi:xanthine dehydrogenase accessory factor
MRILKWAVGTSARYIAMIGSRRKVIGVVRELEKEGVPSALFEKISAPMGLEIAAESPEEIAVSVVAEMIAVRRGAPEAWRDISKSIFATESSRAALK